MNLISLASFVLAAGFLLMHPSKSKVDPCVRVVQIDSIVYNNDKETMQHFKYNATGNLTSVITGNDTVAFYYLDEAIMRVQKAGQNDWDAPRFYALDKMGRLSQGMSKDGQGNMQVESGFEYDETGRLGYLIYANYNSASIQQYSYRYPEKSIQEILVSDQNEGLLYKYQVLLDTATTVCFNIDLNGIGYELFPEGLLGSENRFPVRSITQLSASGDTLAHLVYSTLIQTIPGRWEHSQTDVLNGFATSIVYYTSQKQ